MTPTPLQVEAHTSFLRNGRSVSKTAKELNKTDTAVKKLLFGAALNGLQIGTEFSKALPAGMELEKASVLTDGDGNVKLVWHKGKGISSSVDDFAQFCEQRIPANKVKLPKVNKSNKHLMLEWPVFDPHHGMLAWADETGTDYDHKISRHLQESAGKILFQSFGRVRRTVIILGGDNQTADNSQGVTEKSGNVLDTDTRFAKMVWCSYETSVTCIEMAANFSDEVYVFVLSGNHDPHSAIHLTIQLHAYFRNVQNVKIDTSPEKHRFWRWGSTVFMGTHGDINEKRVAPYMMQQVIRRGMAHEPVERMMVRMGHLHKRGRKTPDMLTEEDGVIVERFPTLAAQEAYSVEAGYTSVRATSANLWHDRHGRYGGREITLGEILERHPI